MSRDVTKGQMLIDDIHKTLQEKIGAEIMRRKWTHEDVTKNCKIAKHDLYNLLSGKGNVPLARVIMFAADLGLKVEMVIE